MKRTNLILVIVVAALALGLFWFFRGPGDRAASMGGESQAAVSGTPGESGALDGPGEGEPSVQRSQAALPAEAAPQPKTSGPSIEGTPSRVSGRVLDTSGIPLAGVRIVLHDRPDADLALSAAGGEFEFPMPKAAIPGLHSAGCVLVLAPGQRWTSALKTPFAEDRRTHLLLVAAPSIELGGVVEDENGGAIEGAKVALQISSMDLRDFPMPLDRSSPLLIESASGAAGVFRMPALPAIGGCKLQARFGDSLRGEVELPMNTTLDLRIVLRPGGGDRPGEKAAFTGVVISAEGRPVDGATVRFGPASTKTGSGGRFELPLPEWTPRDAPLVAVKKGFQPALVNDIAIRLEQEDFSPLVLRLGPPTLEIQGRVLQSDGKPAKNWTVALGDGTEVSRGSVPAVIAEGLAAGSSQGKHSASTDSDGEFILRGLSARNYSVRAWQPKTLLSLRAENVAAGTRDLVLRVPADATWPEVRGIVVDRRGSPVAQVQVAYELVTFSSGGAQSWESSAGIETKEDGAFLLKNVPRSEVRLSLSGDGIIEQRFEASLIQPDRELRLTVDRRCHFRLVGERTENLPDRAAVIDENGTQLQIFTFQSGGWSSSTQISIDGRGTTHAMAVSERARTLVLFQEDQEIAQVPVTLLPGQVSDVRY